MSEFEHQHIHASGQFHHHHTHAAHSSHVHGRHLLQVENLSVGFRMYDTSEPFFRAKQKMVRAIENLSISVHAGEIVAVVGASGSGKTLLADSIMGLHEPNSYVSGSIWFDGVLQDAQSLAQLRGRGLSYVPQGVNYLDPLMKVGKQVRGCWRGRRATVGEGRAGLGGSCARSDGGHSSSGKSRTRLGGNRAAAGGGCAFSGNLEIKRLRVQRQRELFARYGLAPEVAQLYPHELSGGMARRVLLCCALMENPQVIIADEPTPGLDADLAVRALANFRSFANAGGGVMLITHDIELALRVADRVAVFLDGTIVEETSVENFASPDLLRHPFSRALWHALPEHDFASDGPDAAAAASMAAAPHDGGCPILQGGARKADSDGSFGTFGDMGAHKTINMSEVLVHGESTYKKAAANEKAGEVHA